jgi:hypothetical protein
MGRLGVVGMTVFATQADLAAAIAASNSAAWPVGSIFTSVVATNPATLLGFGTWAAFGTGRVLVGIDTGDTDFDTVEETGGAKTHTHAAGTLVPSAHVGAAVADHASHTHTYTAIVDHTHAVNVSDPGHTHGGRIVNSGTAGTAGHQGASTNNNANASTSATQTGTTSITATTSNPVGSVATGTTNGPSATLTHAVTQPSAHTMSGTSAAANGLPPYIVVYMWERTA